MARPMRAQHVAACCAGVLAALALLLLAAPGATGQGVPLTSEAMLVGASQSAAVVFEQQEKAAWAWAWEAYRKDPVAACKPADGSLRCAAGRLDDTTFQLATSPQTFDLGPISSGHRIDYKAEKLFSFPAFSELNYGDAYTTVPLQQGDACNTCASAAVAGAADSAIAVALEQKKPAPAFSVQDLHFCASRSLGSRVRDCSSLWSLSEAVEALGKLSSKLVAPACLPYAPSSTANLCVYKCKDVTPVLRSGRFESKNLNGIADIQAWLRNHGGVVSSMVVDPGFKAFFRAKPDGVYEGPAKANDPGSFGHAVQIVGYGHDFWRIKNSWGARFGDGGYAKVRFGASGLGAPASTIGIRFVPAQPQGWRPELLDTPPAGSKLVARPGCKYYSYALAHPHIHSPLGVRKSPRFDSTDGLATALGVDARRLLFDNTATMMSPDHLREDLAVCSGASTAKVPQLPAEARALLAIKQAIDKKGALTSWTDADPSDGAWCSWEGVQCDKGLQVREIELSKNALGGAVPKGALLRALPALEQFSVPYAQLTGPLPADLGGPNLRVLYLSDNQLTGTIPAAAWSTSMPGIKMLLLSNNALSGPLPSQLAQLRTLSTLDVHGNQLTGTLPPELGKLPELGWLRLFSNRFTGSLPAEWANLVKLDELNVSHNALSGDIPRAWFAPGKLLSKTPTIDLAGNKGLRVCGKAPPSGVYPKLPKAC